MYFCKYTSDFTGGSQTYKTSAVARTGFGRIVKRFSSSWSISDMVRCPADVIMPSMTIQDAVRASWNFKKYINLTRHRTMTFYGAIFPGAVRY